MKNSTNATSTLDLFKVHVIINDAEIKGGEETIIIEDLGSM
jgi:hypothetical protein